MNAGAPKLFAAPRKPLRKTDAFLSHRWDFDSKESPHHPQTALMARPVQNCRLKSLLVASSVDRLNFLAPLARLKIRNLPPGSN